MIDDTTLYMSMLDMSDLLDMLDLLDTYSMALST